MAQEQSWDFPKKKDETRLSSYTHYDQIYFGDHFKAFSIKAPKGFNEAYAKLRYVVANFAGLASRVMADMLFGEPLVIDVKDKTTQEWLDGLIDDTHYRPQLYESALANSRRGDSVFKIWLENSTDDKKKRIHIDEINPAIYFPEVDPNSSRNRTSKDVLAWVWEESEPANPQKPECYLTKETHTAGQVETEVFKYDKDKKKVISQLSDQEVKKLGIEPKVATLINRSLVFHIPNVRDGSSFFGTSDYKDLESLFFALNNRITKIDNILDKHSDPILAVPPGVLDEKGKVRKERLGMFEVDNTNNSSFNKPEYIVWNANLESAFKEIDTMIEMLFMFSEISPATMGMDKEGAVESGRALKFKMLRTIAKRNRKKIYYDIAIKEMLETAMEFGKAWKVQIDGKTITKPEKPEIKWGDGTPPDMTEMIDNEVKRLGAGLSSVPDSLSKLDGLKPEDAKKKAAEIDESNNKPVPALGNTPAQNENTPTPPNTGE